ncbi:glycosyltransferase family 2 protein [Butyricimonas paravirosa]|uniref:glycosyltransferase family 2 protein n=1 Tax=Butyricimonas paravirosa TaxID=1472417 RepID=UPI00210E02DC|nr:glycosyltransferase family 2 protein [Butyricimonas paravirosa]MCQ4873466.1 glycosyltransferase family 2 protein [Butyricimonas paravirosa]
MLSVVCPIYNEEKYIRGCIESIVAQDYPKDCLEVLFVDGMSVDATRGIVVEYSKRFSFIRLLDNPKKIVPSAMNIGIQAAKGEIIIRLDAHAYYCDNYFSVLVKRLEELNADNVGCVCKTDVLFKTPKTLAICEVLGNRFGVGNSTFRTGVDNIMEVDTVPFGCWRSDVFKKYGLYDERLVRNQDIELNKRIIRDGGRICIVPDTYCIYYARERFRTFTKNNYENGKWNVLTVFYTKKLDSLSIRHFIPLLFVLSLVLPVLASVLWGPLLLLGLISLSIYGVALGSISLFLAYKKKLNFFYLLVSFIILHLSYGWGALVGICRLPFIK